MKHVHWTWPATLGLLSGTALADSVVLDNGDRLSGTVVQMTADALEIETTYAGKVKLSWARVRRIETEAPVRVQLVDGTEFDGQLQDADAGQLRVDRGRAAQPATLTLDRVAAINPPRHPDRAVLTGRASAGGSFTQGNTDAQSLHLSGELVARKPTQRVTLNGEANEAEQNGARSASNWRLGAKYDHFINPRTYYYANTRFDHDSQADLDLRSTFGLGVGRQLIDRKDKTLSIEGGVSLVNENYASAESQRFPSARTALKYEQTFLGGRLTLFHHSDFLFSLESWDDTLYQTRTGLRLPVGNGLSLGTQVNVDYDPVPAAGRETTDTAVIFKLDYKI